MRLIKGFTLVELMIVVVIVGILFGVAYPSYQNSIRRSDRSEAKAELMNVAQRMEKCRTAYGRYDSDSCGVYMEMKGAATITSTGKGFYSVDFATASAVTLTTYRLTAAAIKTPQTKDTDCTELTLTNTGVKEPEGCW